jgi:hypothetical protein
MRAAPRSDLRARAAVEKKGSTGRSARIELARSARCVAARHWAVRARSRAYFDVLWRAAFRAMVVASESLLAHPAPPMFPRRRPASEVVFAPSNQEGRGEVWLMALIAACAAVVAALSLRKLEIGESAAPLAHVQPASAPELSEGARQLAPLAATALPSEPDDAPALVRDGKARERWTEAEHVEQLRSVSEDGAFRAALDAALAPGRSAAESSAALRVAYERLGSGALEHYRHAARELAQPTAPGRESVARAAIHALGVRATREPAARALLTELACDATLEPTLRAASASAVLAAVPLEELDALAVRLDRADRALRELVDAALQARRAPLTSNAEAES